jgi:aminoglycoside/choline kinase family phosphotransferase
MDKLKRWLNTTAFGEYALSVASADASFRKYYRLTKGVQTFIVMDSSLELDSLKPFIGITARLTNAKVKVPKIYAQNLELGYLVLEDFGDTKLLDVLDTNNFQTLYKQAIDEILKMQEADASKLPLYDKDFLHFEMDLMQEWYLEKKLGLSLSTQEKNLLHSTLQNISQTVLSQPQGVFVHRDFHSRNIMLNKDKELGIIDYQDAMSGAITYDLVSLLKDCYISFAREDIEELVLYFKAKVSPQSDTKEFIKAFDFMGLQRHIKVLGVFSRLHIRDKKEGYLKDIPLTLKYTIETALRYEQTKELAAFLQRVSV